MPVDPKACVRISAFNWVPPFAQGYVRDLRVRWALEEAGIPYAVRKLNAAAYRPADYFDGQPFGQVPSYRDDNISLFESGAIVLHIGRDCEVLLPSDEAAQGARYGVVDRGTEQWTSPNSVGVSSAIIKSSNKRSGSDISKDEAGAASITTPRCASPPTDFWSPRGRGFPPQDLVTPLGSKNLPFPNVIDPEAPPPRTERHVPNSIATMRRRLIVALVSTLSRCPCCATSVGKGSRRQKL
jgi:Glutathione S-transferase, N-terminal domain